MRDGPDFVNVWDSCLGLQANACGMHSIHSTARGVLRARMQFLKLIFGFTWSGGMSRVLVALWFEADCGVLSKIDSREFNLEVMDVGFLVRQPATTFECLWHRWEAFLCGPGMCSEHRSGTFDE
jgi:hypothetical protein